MSSHTAEIVIVATVEATGFPWKMHFIYKMLMLICIMLSRKRLASQPVNFIHATLRVDNGFMSVHGLIF